MKNNKELPVTKMESSKAFRKFVRSVIVALVITGLIEGLGALFPGSVIANSIQTILMFPFLVVAAYSAFYLLAAIFYFAYIEE